jgi:hypothetical protein
MHYLDPETRERVIAASERAQREGTTPDTHIDNSGSDGLGTPSHVRLVYLSLILISSVLPGTGGGNVVPTNANVPSAAINTSLLGRGVSSQREPSRFVYPVAAHSATWTETDNPSDRASDAVSNAVQPSNINQEHAPSQDGNDENLNNPENTMTTDAAIADKILTILSAHIPMADPEKIASTISETIDSLKAGDNNQNTARPPQISSTQHNQSTSDFLDGNSSDVISNK